MQTEILFRAKIQGTFTREGFTASNSGSILTITKFTDGTFIMKFGRKVFKERFSTCKKLSNIISQHIGINL